MINWMIPSSTDQFSGTQLIKAGERFPSRVASGKLTLPGLAPEPHTPDQKLKS